MGGSRGAVLEHTVSSGTRGESPTRLALLGTLRASFARLDPASGRGEEHYVAAVVTPPSTTMVWPVMNVDASEAR